MSSPRVLCSDGMEVTVNVQGDRTLLFVKDGSATRFWTDTSSLQRSLQGEPAVIDAHGGQCRVTVEGEKTRFDYSDGDGENYSCTFKTHELADALAAVDPMSHSHGES